MNEPMPVSEFVTACQQLIEQLAGEQDTNTRTMLEQQLRDRIRDHAQRTDAGARK